MSEQPTVIDLANITQHQNWLQLCVFLKECLNRGGKRLLDSTIPLAAAKFNLLTYGVEKIWKIHKASVVNPVKFKIDVAQKKGSGRKQTIPDAELQARV